jgi:hypothetical protein
MSDLKSEKIFESQTSSSTLKDEKGGKIKYPFPMEGEQFTIYNLQFTIYNLQFTIYNLQFTIY